ncbi:DUF1697 domain-containing protein, partial [Psychroserpens sp.]
IKKAIAYHFGFDVPVIVKTTEELARILEACPFSEEKKTSSYFIVLSAVPASYCVDEVKHIKYNDEEFEILGDCLYFYTANGYGRTKFNIKTFEKKLKVKATSRNYKTMVKLLAISSEI